MAEYIEREAINRICFMDYFLVDGIRPFAGMPILRRDLFKAWRKCREIVELLPQLRGQDGRRWQRCG